MVVDVDAVAVVIAIERRVLEFHKGAATHEVKVGIHKRAVFTQRTRIFTAAIGLPVQCFVATVVGVVVEANITQIIATSREVIEVLDVIVELHVGALILTRL